MIFIIKCGIRVEHNIHLGVPEPWGGSCGGANPSAAVCRGGVTAEPISWSPFHSWLQGSAWRGTCLRDSRHGQEASNR